MVVQLFIGIWERPQILSNKFPPPYSCFFFSGFFFFFLNKILANTVFSSIFTTYEVGALIFSVL